jgi:2-iminobutanoate/2-iminopropanoate deaminase
VVPGTFKEQAELAWGHVNAQLAAAGMTIGNLVKATTFLSSREYAIENRTVWQAVLGNHGPALTVVITGVFDERWLLEIETIAAA